MEIENGGNEGEGKGGGEVPASLSTLYYYVDIMGSPRSSW